MQQRAHIEADDRYRSRNRVGKWVLGGCGAVVGIVLILVVLFVVFFSKGRANFTPLLEGFLTLSEQREYRQAYDSVGDQWKESDTFEEFQTLFMLIGDALGPHESLQMTTVHYQKNFGSPAVAKVVFTGKFEKAPATLRVTLKKYDGSWKIEGFHVESKAFTAKLTCPYCGTVNPYKAHHCSNCGEKIERPTVAEDQREVA